MKFSKAEKLKAINDRYDAKRVLQLEHEVRRLRATIEAHEEEMARMSKEFMKQLKRAKSIIIKKTEDNDEDVVQPVVKKKKEAKS